MTVCFVVCVVPPKMTDNRLQVQGIEGTEARISCSASGLPPPKYEFFKVSRSYTVCQIVTLSVSIT